jgi:hypothetical protein
MMSSESEEEEYYISARSEEDSEMSEAHENIEKAFFTVLSPYVDDIKIGINQFLKDPDTDQAKETLHYLFGHL